MLYCTQTLIFLCLHLFRPAIRRFVGLIKLTKFEPRRPVLYCTKRYINIVPFSTLARDLSIRRTCLLEFSVIIYGFYHLFLLNVGNVITNFSFLLNPVYFGYGCAPVSFNLAVLCYWFWAHLTEFCCLLFSVFLLDPAWRLVNGYFCYLMDLQLIYQFSSPHCISPWAEDGFSTNEGLFVGCVGFFLRTLLVSCRESKTNIQTNIHFSV